MQNLGLASNNAGKVIEFNNILSKFGYSVQPMADFNIQSPAETGTTFVENAIIKARYMAQITKMPCLADDSGLVVQALNGAPGIYSSRFSGTGDSHKNNEFLLQKMQNISQRDAYFFSCVVLLQSHDDPDPTIATGRWQGKIAKDFSGFEGFGYDPIFIPHAYILESKLVENKEQKTAAMLTNAEKNASSHRVKASVKLIKLLQENR